jgi:hypothetical protein
MAGIALVATNVGWLGERHRHAETRAAWAAEQTAAAQAARDAEAEYRAREKTNADTLTAITKKAEDEKAVLRRRAAALADSLRNRPDPPAGGGDVPTVAAGDLGCTGAGLYRPHAGFLVGEAARANQLRAELAECRAKYDAAVKLTAPVLH